MKPSPTVVLLQELVDLQKKNARQKEDNFGIIASMTAIGVITTAVSFLGAFTLRDFLKSLFETITPEKPSAAQKLMYTTIVFAAVVCVLIMLVYLKNSVRRPHLESDEEKSDDK